MSTEEKLSEVGYKKWKTEQDHSSLKEMFQKRMDIIEQHKGYPLCKCNDKILINIDHHHIEFRNGMVSDSYTMSLAHENKDCDWCDLRIYNLSAEKLVDSLPKYEEQLLDMWRVFYES